MRIERFKPEHLTQMRMQPVQIGRFSSPEYAQLLSQGGTALTAFGAEEILMCAGCFNYGIRGGSLWAMISPAAGIHFVALHRAASRFIESLCMERIEATVEAGFTPGCRWLEMLGFHCETPVPMRRFGQDGRDHYLYARVRP